VNALIFAVLAAAIALAYYGYRYAVAASVRIRVPHAQLIEYKPWVPGRRSDTHRGGPLVEENHALLPGGVGTYRLYAAGAFERLITGF